MPKQTIIPPVTNVGPSGPYAGVLRRFCALVIDRVIVNVSLFLLFIPLAMIAAVGSSIATPMALSIEGLSAITFWSFLLLADWIYFASLESSERGATFGKRLLGMRVTDTNGRRISFGRATVRYFSKILSAIPFMLGYVMAFFTKKTQALHDLIADTVVIRV